MLEAAHHHAEYASDATISRLRSICAGVGLDLDALSPFVLERMRLLADVTKTAADSAHMVAIARAIFDYYDRHRPDRRWTEAEQRIVVLGCVFSDVGKTGPVHADAEGQRLVAEMFAVEGVKDVQQSVETFLRAHFPREADERLQRFRGLELDPGMPMRAFWDLHTSWTLDIVEAGGLPLEAVAAAATHHFLDDINPKHVVAHDGRFSRPFGDNVAFDRAEKLVIVLDKYDAVRRRGASSHEEAIAWLRRWVSKRERSRDDGDLATSIADLDLVMGRGDPP